MVRIQYKSIKKNLIKLYPNELLLGQLIQHLDGKPNHPTGFKGAIGKILENCEKLSVISFGTIEVELPNIDPKEFSTDQKYLLTFVTEFEEVIYQCLCH